MKPQGAPLHINAKKEEIAEVVLLPGDPLRAKYIADNFLTNVKLVTSVRNMYGFTGEYKGKRITVMGSGMGMASCGIYVFELFYYYNVQTIIRIGTCGVVSKKVDIPEIILADRVYSESNYAHSYNGYTGNTVIPSLELNRKIEETAKKKGIQIHKGTLMTTDVFGPYVDDEAYKARMPEGIEPLGEEMEAFGLCHIANVFNRQATAMCTATDSKFSGASLTPQERQLALNEMIELALDSIV